MLLWCLHDICPPPSPGVFPTPLPLQIPRPTSFERWMGRLFAVITAVPLPATKLMLLLPMRGMIPNRDPKVKMSFQLHSLGKNDAAKGKPQTEKPKWRKWSRVCQNTDRISNSAIFDTPDCRADRHHGGKLWYFSLCLTKLILVFFLAWNHRCMCGLHWILAKPVKPKWNISLQVASEELIDAIYHHQIVYPCQMWNWYTAET